MRLFFLLPVFFLSLHSFSQEDGIDSLVTTNESNIGAVYQKTEKNKMFSSDASNENQLCTVYRYTDKNSLSSITVSIYTDNDTSIRVNYYFNLDRLIKVRSECWVSGNKKPDDVFYFKNDKPLNSANEINGPYRPEKYLSMARRHLKLLKEKPIRFPE